YLGSEDFKDVTPAYRYGIAMYSKYLRGETPVAEEKDIDVIVDQELSSLTNFNSLIDISDSCDSLTDKLKSFGIYNTKQLKNYHKGKSYRNNILYSNSPYSIREYFGNIVSSHYNDHNLYNNHNLNNMIKLVDIISGNDFNMSKHHILLDLLVERVRLSVRKYEYMNEIISYITELNTKNKNELIEYIVHEDDNYMYLPSVFRDDSIFNKMSQKSNFLFNEKSIKGIPSKFIDRIKWRYSTSTMGFNADELIDSPVGIMNNLKYITGDEVINSKNIGYYIRILKLMKPFYITNGFSFRKLFVQEGHYGSDTCTLRLKEDDNLKVVAKLIAYMLDNYISKHSATKFVTSLANNELLGAYNSNSLKVVYNVISDETMDVHDVIKE